MSETGALAESEAAVSERDVEWWWKRVEEVDAYRRWISEWGPHSRRGKFYRKEVEKRERAMAELVDMVIETAGMGDKLSFERMYQWVSKTALHQTNVDIMVGGELIWQGREVGVENVTRTDLFADLISAGKLQLGEETDVEEHLMVAVVSMGARALEAGEVEQLRISDIGLPE